MLNRVEPTSCSFARAHACVMYTKSCKYGSMSESSASDSISAISFPSGISLKIASSEVSERSVKLSTHFKTRKAFLQSLSYFRNLILVVKRIRLEKV